MPLTNTGFAGSAPISGMVRCTAFRIALSPQPGHQRTSWSEAKSAAVSLVISFISSFPFVPSEVEGRSRACLDSARHERVRLSYPRASSMAASIRSEERRVGKGGVSKLKSRWDASHEKKKTNEI